MRFKLLFVIFCFAKKYPAFCQTGMCIAFAGKSSDGAMCYCGEGQRSPDGFLTRNMTTARTML